MTEADKKHTSKFLSLVLRHKPETIGLVLDENGWAGVQELMEKSAQKNVLFSMPELEEIVATNDKKRFAFNEDKTMIRASQGHSIGVELELVQETAPDILYHGTVEKFMESIWEKGLQKMSRHHVHLSDNADTARQVGSRRGKPVLLIIQAGVMQADGYAFYKSANGVWLTGQVPPQYISA
jgi:putative RNA 2'-phosphotransferase